MRRGGNKPTGSTTSEPATKEEEEELPAGCLGWLCCRGVVAVRDYAPAESRTTTTIDGASRFAPHGATRRRPAFASRASLAPHPTPRYPDPPTPYCNSLRPHDVPTASIATILDGAAGSGPPPLGSELPVCYPPAMYARMCKTAMRY